MDSSSRHTLLKVFEQMIEWRKRKKWRKRDSARFNWTEFHLSVVHGYVSKLALNSDFWALSLVKLFEDEFWYRMPGSCTKDAKIVASFAKELQEFFIVPKQHQLFERDDTLKQNELVAAFINLLLRLLNRRPWSIRSFEDRIVRLEKELRFLLTVLGDKSLICDEHEQVKNLLAEFEAVANEAGSLVHSVVFSTFADRIFKTMDERLGVPLKHMDLLKANVIKFSNLQPVIAATNIITSKTAVVDSLFIVDSLLYDLEDLLNREDDVIADVKDQIKVLQQELIKSFTVFYQGHKGVSTFRGGRVQRTCEAN